MPLEHGTRDDHLGTLRRAKANKITSVWSGDLRRNAYLRESLNFGIEEGILKVEDYDYAEAQESGFNIIWLKSEF